MFNDALGRLPLPGFLIIIKDKVDSLLSSVQQREREREAETRIDAEYHLDRPPFDAVINHVVADSNRKAEENKVDKEETVRQEEKEMLRSTERRRPRRPWQSPE